MKKQCPSCKKIFSITCAPHLEGYFITEEKAEQMGNIKEPSLLDFSKFGDRVTKCPSCGIIS